MAFVGSINADLRALLAELAPSWRGRPCYVACSGNFTVERLLHQAGIREIHSSDVSLYSCVLGSTLAGAPIPVTLTPDTAFPWLEPSLTPGLPTVATLLLAMEYFKSAGRPEPYHRRMARAYEQAWPSLHARSLEKITRLVDGLRLASFTPQDCVPFVEAVPADAVVVTFAPTYTAGYEKLYAALDATFAWPAPTYELFTPDRFALLCMALQRKSAWVTMRDEPVDALASACIGRFQTSAGAKPVYAYAGGGPIRTTAVHQTTEPVPWRHLAELADGWFDPETEEAKHQGWVPLATIFGTDTLPADAAAVLKRAVDRIVVAEQLPAHTRWRALEFLAAEALSGANCG
jgi:hypothetical protein